MLIIKDKDDEYTIMNPAGTLTCSSMSGGCAECNSEK